jgi:hypothetical protein
MPTMTDYLPVINAVMQWLIVPSVVVIWHLNGRISRQETEILRILTILDERERRRDEDREDNSQIFKNLHAAIETLSAKIDRLHEHYEVRK